jgi:hypothetical protein
LDIILIINTVILFLVQFLFLKKICDEREIIEKSNTILEWTVPRKAWHITEARWFSPSMLVLWFAICFATFFSVFAIAMKLHPPAHIDKNTLTFAQLPAFSAVLSALCVALVASSWWWARLKVKLTTYGIERTFHNSTKIWKYDRIKSYHFEPLHSQTDVYTLVVIRNHKGKTWKIALDNSVNKAKIEEILNEHGIPKLEQST